MCLDVCKDMCPRMQDGCPVSAFSAQAEAFHMYVYRCIAAATVDELSARVAAHVDAHVCRHAHVYVSAVQRRAVTTGGVNELLDDTRTVALRMYTTQETLHVRELCGMLNEALRQDIAAHAVVLTRALNMFLVTGRNAYYAHVKRHNSAGHNYGGHNCVGHSYIGHD